MSRRDKFEDDGRTIADMSELEGMGLFGRRPRASRSGKNHAYGSDPGSSGSNGTKERPPWEDAPFTWKERLRYMGMALGAALSIAFVFLAGLALVIWLITLYA